MTVEEAIGVLSVMRGSYTSLAEDRTLVDGRRQQASRRLKAINTALVALTLMEEKVEANLLAARIEAVTGTGPEKQWVDDPGRLADPVG